MSLAQSGAHSVCLSPDEREEVTDALSRLQLAHDRLAVRGLRAAGARELAGLRSHMDELTRLEARHLGGRVGDLIRAIEAHDAAGGAALLRANASLRLFERVLSLNAARVELEAWAARSDPIDPEADGAQPAAGEPPPLPPGLERTLPPVAQAVEDLLLGGLTAVGESTRRQLRVTFQEAARLRLLRLGSSLRVVNEELGRFTRGETEGGGSTPAFSPQRFLFFLTHAWLLGHGLVRAAAAGDRHAAARLNGASTRRPLPWAEVVTLGAAKKEVRGAFCAFELRLRALEGAGLQPGQALTWSHVFPLKGQRRIAPEAFLQLELKQRFRTRDLLEGRVVRIEDAFLADSGGATRLLLGPESSLAPGEPFRDWEPLARWDPHAALCRLRAHEPTPLSLELEPCEEVWLRDWSLGPERELEREQRVERELVAGGVACTAVASSGLEGQQLRAELKRLAKRRRPPPLFALAHYARCGVVLRPLAVLNPAGPRQLMLSDETTGAAALLKHLF